MLFVLSGPSSTNVHAGFAKIPGRETWLNSIIFYGEARRAAFHAGGYATRDCYFHSYAREGNFLQLFSALFQHQVHGALGVLALDH